MMKLDLIKKHLLASDWVHAKRFSRRRVRRPVAATSHRHQRGGTGDPLRSGPMSEEPLQLRRVRPQNF